MLTAYAWRGERQLIRNFGDELTPLLIERFTEHKVRLVNDIKDAQVIAVGSILDLLPPKEKEWKGAIIGSGILRPTAKVDLSAARVLALRGPLTRKLVKGLERGPSFALGDLGLLSDELVAAPERVHKLGIVPHWSDTKLEHRPEWKQFKPLIIRPTWDPLDVIAAIGSCEKIVASSLHGIIVADAFGIPRRTEMFERAAKEGGTFKWEDYSASLGVPFRLGETQIIPRSKIQDRQHELFDAVRSL